MNPTLRQTALDNLRRGRDTQSKAARERYYTDPAICKNCGKIIELDGKQRPSAIKKKKFCNHSCAAAFNNKGKDRWVTKRTEKESAQISYSQKGICKTCGISFPLSPRKTRSLKNRGYYKARFCPTCREHAKIRARGGWETSRRKN